MGLYIDVDQVGAVLLIDGWRTVADDLVQHRRLRVPLLRPDAPCAAGRSTVCLNRIHFHRQHRQLHRQPADISPRRANEGRRLMPPPNRSTAPSAGARIRKTNTTTITETRKVLYPRCSVYAMKSTTSAHAQLYPTAPSHGTTCGTTFHLRDPSRCPMDARPEPTQAAPGEQYLRGRLEPPSEALESAAQPGEDPYADIVTLLAAVLTDSDQAARRSLHHSRNCSTFDADDQLHAEAVQICASCPALDACRSWVASLPTGHVSSVIAGEIL